MGNPGDEDPGPTILRHFTVSGEDLPSRLVIRGALKNFGSIRSIADCNSGLRISFDGISNHSALSALTTIAGRTVSINEDSSAKGTIFCPEFQYCSDAEIKEELDGGITLVKRLPAKNMQALESSPRLLLQFPCTPAPSRITLRCGLICDIRPHIPIPLRCRNCWEFAHHERACRSDQPRCGRCSELGHTSDQCSSQTPKCFACGGPHIITAASCPAWKKSMSINRIRVNKGVTTSQATRILKSQQRTTEPNTAKAPQPSSKAPPLINRSYAAVVAATPASPKTASATSSSPSSNNIAAILQRLDQRIAAQTEMFQTMMQGQMQILSSIVQQNTELIALMKCNVPNNSEAPNSRRRRKPSTDSTPPTSKKQALISAFTAPASTPPPVTPISKTVSLGRDMTQPSTPRIATIDLKHIDVYQKNQGK